MVAEVNPDALDDHKGLIANPNCSTMQLMVALKPIHDAAGIERLIVSTYQSVSGTGVKAVEELEAQTHAVLHGEEPPAPQVYPHPIAFNVLGGAGNFVEATTTPTKSCKMMFETRKILGDEDDRDQRHLRARAGPQLPLGVGDPADARAARGRGGARAAVRACPA